MNQWIGHSAAMDDLYRPEPWRHFVVTAPLSVVAIIAMLLGSRFLKPSLPHPHESNAIEAQLVEVTPPKPGGLQGGASTVPVKPKPAEKPHPKPVPQHHPKVANPAPPVISPSETSEVGTGPSVPTTSGPSTAKDTGVVLVETGRKLAPATGSELGILEMLDDRRYTTALKPGQKAVFVASSRRRL